MLTKKLNGKTIILSPKEEAQTKAKWAANTIKQAQVDEKNKTKISLEDKVKLLEDRIRVLENK